MTKPTIFDPVTTYVLPSTAARYIRTTEAELARDREREQPEIPFVLLAGEIRYSRRELDAFLSRVQGGDADE